MNGHAHEADLVNDVHEDVDEVGGYHAGGEGEEDREEENCPGGHQPWGEG